MKLHQSGNKIIVTELNPMSEKPNVLDRFIAFTKTNYAPFECWCSLEGTIYVNATRERMEESHFAGWLPMPVYDPSAKSAGQIAYERDLDKYPLYHDGSKRPEWHQLPEHTQETWNRNPRDRFIKYEQHTEK